MIKNFGLETRARLVDEGYMVQDIAWCGTREFEVPIAEFLDFADRITYDSGYGINFIPLDIIIVMNDGSWFERREYDGSEWWAYVRAPVLPYRLEHLRMVKLMQPYEADSLSYYIR